jgi:hypothetical protein
MALVEIFHVVAAERPVATGQTIKEGQIVSLDISGNVVIQSATNVTPYGIAGDTKSTSASYMPGIASGWQNRVSDYFDETKASAKMTVYHSGGEFATDQFAANVASATIMAPLYAYNGVLDTITGQSSVVVAYLVKAAGTYPSGVPGVDLNGDQALGGDSTASGLTNEYIEIKLEI